MIVKERKEHHGSGEYGVGEHPSRQKSRHNNGANRKMLKTKLSKRNNYELIEGGEEKLVRAAENIAKGAQHLGREKSAIFTRRHTRLETSNSN